MHAEAIMTPMPEGLSQQQVKGFSKPGLLPLFFVPPYFLHQWLSGAFLFKHMKHINILAYDVK